MWRNILLWKENIQESRKRIRHRPVRSGGSGWTDQTMRVVQPDKDGDGQTKMGTAGQRWGRPDKDGDGRTKMGTAGQRWGQPDKDGDGWTKMGTNPDITPPSKVQRPDAPIVKGEVLVGQCGGTRQLTA